MFGCTISPRRSSGGDLTTYFQRYAAKAGTTLDRQIIYYLAHVLIRSAAAFPHLTRHADWRSTVALNLGYETICAVVSCEAIGLYHGVACPSLFEQVLTNRLALR